MLQLMNNLKAVRKQKGITQAQLSAQSGVDQSTISLLEREDAEVDPKWSTVFDLSSALEVEPASLFPVEKKAKQ
jgi:transcriptional regulator with XRE-family HTH domain